ncbi:pyridoxal-5'-phosphate-dependent protein [Streptomyces viridochromogenes]|uniref:Pyridoxal-5'-phosphate-dependent protein n=1 Tax=Streptomyces viridochromogenes TaxID=1938 RepID=A0A0J7ZLC7_STRVR|nr:pyridoxal-phosphate dependent enzyme [Streptomyces viridochromogenes]KMS76227.1 pyridoxal-5'-phosphate-dependent protein [Streptomyces viridochromogenes]KOG25056.1 pyridoxal-5'-phosphate-dependent protein [Streptomyces viridochromogenes]KOG26523.1 pyridoxal-5'-phosphate-dependent protein [Streptomyces viridochromogenes]
MIFNDLVDAIGHTPVVRLRAAPADVTVVAKLELQNLFAMKDRVARQVIREARENGVLAPGAPIIESSSGTMALGLALAGHALGHPVHIVTDPRIDAITLAKLTALGCSVHVVEGMTSNGWQSARLERLASLREEFPGAFWPRQYSNPQNPLAYAALAEELVADLGGIDVLVGAVGSGGSLCGTARALRRALKAAGRSAPLRVVGVDAVGSVLFGQPDQPGRKQSGIGNSLIPGNLDYAHIDEIHWLNDREAFAATRDLARDEGIFAGNSSGSVYQVLKHLAATVAPGTRVVGIFPDRGDRYVDSIYDDTYWQQAGLAELPLRTEPLHVRYGTEVSGWARAEVPSTPRKRLVFVESNTTGTGMLAFARARDLGLAPVLLTNRPGRYPGIGEADCEIIRCDTNSADGPAAALRAHFAPDEVAGATTTSEFYLEAAASLAESLGLPGNPPAAVGACRRKSATRRLLADAGLPQPVSTSVTRAADVPEAVAAAGLPCVVKPASDSASTGVLLCTSVEQAQEHAAKLLAITHNVREQAVPPEVLVEELVQGPEFSVETIFADGALHLVGITRKSVSPPPSFVELRHAFPAPLEEAEYREIEQVVRAAIKAIGLRHGACHTELRLTAAGPTIIEINARLAGGMIPELIRLAGGPDLLTQQLRAAAGMAVELPRGALTPTGVAFITSSAEGRLASLDGVESARLSAGVAEVRIARRPGDPVRPATDAYDRIGYVIASGDSVAQLDQSLDSALGRITVRLTND